MGLTATTSIRAQTDAQAPATAEYEGPSVLTRGGMPGALGGRKLPNLAFRPFIGLTGTWSDGLQSARTNKDGKIAPLASWGEQAIAGAYFYHSSRNTQIGLDYRIGARHYSQAQGQDGINQNLSLGLSHRLGRSAVFTLSESAAYVSDGTGFMGANLLDFANRPSNLSNGSEIFNDPVLQLSTNVGLTLNVTPRFSIHLGGGYGLYRHRSTALYGNTIYSAGGDVAYRVSRGFTTGISYGFNKYAFNHSFGSSFLHSVSLINSIRLSRNWEFSTSAGVFQTENLFIGVVALDPLVAILTGRFTGAAVVYNKRYGPTITASLRRSFRNGGFAMGYIRGTTPGNGVYLTSQEEGGNISYSYAGFKSWGLGVSAVYNRISSLTQSLKPYSSASGSFGASRNLRFGMSLVMSYAYQKYFTNFQSGRRQSNSASVGFAWSPGDLPLKIF